MCLTIAQLSLSSNRRLLISVEFGIFSPRPRLLKFLEISTHQRQEDLPLSLELILCRTELMDLQASHRRLAHSCLLKEQVRAYAVALFYARQSVRATRELWR